MQEGWKSNVLFCKLTFDRHLSLEFFSSEDPKAFLWFLFHPSARVLITLPETLRLLWRLAASCCPMVTVARMQAALLTHWAAGETVI